MSGPASFAGAARADLVAHLEALRATVAILERATVFIQGVEADGLMDQINFERREDGGIAIVLRGGPAGPFPDLASAATSAPAPPAPRHANAWTAEEDETLAEIFGRGGNEDEAAAAIGRTPAACKQRVVQLRKRGVMPPSSRRNGHAGGRQPVLDWSPEIVGRIRDMRADGWSVDRIAKSLGRTKGAILGHFARNEGGLPPMGAGRMRPPAPRTAADAHRGVPSAPGAPRLVRDALRTYAGVDGLDPWPISEDLAVVQGLVQGRKAAAIADDLGRSREDIVARWRHLRAGDDSLAGQQALLEALALVDMHRKEAAA